MASSSSSTTSSAVRVWRTAFLTLRDETLTTPPRTPIPQLLQTLIFSSSNTLLAAVNHLSRHEVTSDMLFLLDLVSLTKGQAEDMASTYTDICYMINDVCRKVSLEINLSSWLRILNSFKKMVEFFLWTDGSKSSSRHIADCLDTLRHLIGLYHGKCSGSDNAQLVRFLLHTIACTHAELACLIHLSSNQRVSGKMEKQAPRYSTILDIYPLVFNMLAEAFTRAGSSFTPDVWHSTVEVLRNVMDVLASKSLLLGDGNMCRFYESLLHCLHVVIAEPKCSLSDHVSGFIAALRMFLNYRVFDKPQLNCPSLGLNEMESTSVSIGVNLDGTTKTNKGLYRPPHLRRRKDNNVKGTKAQDFHSCSDQESSIVEIMSSDSDYSDSEGALKDSSSFRSAKVRVAAITCIQALCQADPKSFTTQWTTLLPTSDVLQPRKFEVTLMTCLLYDPFLKARIAAASTIAVMLVCSSSFSLQVAEYKETSKCGSFRSLSSSFGQIIMQLHTGILFLIRHENHTKLLSSTFKILTHLISSTPYSRMPAELLPTLVTSLSARIQEGFNFKSDPTSLLAAAINCLTGALSTSPPSQKVNEIFLEEMSTGFCDAGNSCHILSTLFQHSRLISPAICFEALQALRAVSHNYPNVMFSCWKHISLLVYEIVREIAPEMAVRSWNEHAKERAGFVGDKIITSAIKVLDECLRAISGFKGTEDLLDDKSMETPFTSDFVRAKKISSAPSYGPDHMENTCLSGADEWSEAIEKHLPLVMQHSSAMVRTASVTCFAGITSSVFFSITREKQEFIISAITDAAEYDKVPSVRSAACRAIGVISFFPQISISAEILDKFIHAVEINTHDPLVSVRITASWAWANICDSVRSYIDSSTNSQLIELLTDCSLHLTKDGDKIKSNAVRALGNLSRFVKIISPGCHENLSKGIKILPMKTGIPLGDEKYPRFCRPASWVDSCWVEKVVQAFLSCVSTGNVKVQWNVCHALSNLFLNETLMLQNMDWGPSVFSILLLLLRDSSNFKIRIQAATALAVPESALDYGSSFSDVVQGVAHVLENFGSDQNLYPTSFKYRVALEKQLTSTMLHTLILASKADNQPTKDFLVRKSTFLEEWFKALCSSFVNSIQVEDESSSPENEKKEIISKALESLSEVYRGKNLHSIAQKFTKLEIALK